MHEEAAAEQGVARIDDLDLSVVGGRWVLDQGRQMLGRSTA
jgi:hypothetical protein